MSTPKKMMECPECHAYLDVSGSVPRTVCPQCGAKLYPREGENIDEIEEAQKATTIEPVNVVRSRKSSAAEFLRVIAWILWIGGLIVSILKALNAGIDRWGNAQFSLAVFLEKLLEYGLYGGFTMCAVELFENVQTIANALQGFKITKKD